jgi:hypothetical protein
MRWQPLLVVSTSRSLTKFSRKSKMTKGEFGCAWVSVVLAIREKLNYPEDPEPLDEIARQMGKKSSKPEHIDAVLACVDFNKLKELVK